MIEATPLAIIAGLVTLLLIVLRPVMRYLDRLADDYLDSRERRKGRTPRDEGSGTDRHHRRCVPDLAIRQIHEIHDVVHRFDDEGRPRIWTPKELIRTQEMIAETQTKLVQAIEDQTRILRSLHEDRKAAQ